MSSTTKNTELQLGKPKAFNGFYKMAISWMHSIQFYLAVNKTSYNTDMKKIAFTLLYMTEGSTLTWADTFQENTISGTTISLGTWDDFLKKFQQTFKHQDTTGNVISWLSTTRMTKKNGKFTPSLKGYISTFQSNITCAGITDHNVLISFFATGIPVPLMKRMMSLNTVPDKIDDWYSKATHFQNQWDHTDQIAQRSRRTTQTFQSFSPAKKTRDPDAMDVNSITLPKKLTPKEKEWCIKKGLCFHCRKSRHSSANCTTFAEPPKKPRIQQACKEEKLLELREIEDDN